MNNMKAEKYLFATLIFLFCSHISWSQILDFNPSLADFGVVYSKDSKSVTVKVSNNTARYLTIYQNKVFNKYFSCDDTAFVLAPYGQKDITIYFKPLHNIIHASELFLFIKYHGTQSYHLYGQGRYRESYYDSTENQSEEPLKTILKSIILNLTTIKIRIKIYCSSILICLIIFKYIIYYLNIILII